MSSQAHAEIGDKINATEACETRCIGCRVDYLQIAFRVEFSAQTRLDLRNRVAAARDHGSNVAELITGRLFAQLRVPRTGDDRFNFENADLRGMIGFAEQGGWGLEFHVRAVYLATHDLKDSISMCEEIAAAMGAVDGRRLRRLDLSADFTGFPLHESMAGAFLKPRRAKLGTFQPEAKDLDTWHLPERRTYIGAGNRVTGFVICPGNAASARVYDKTAELELSGREEKKAIEIDRWKRNGWTEDQRVTRVEFQLRGVALDELEMRDPAFDKISKRIDPIWQYLTREWLQMVDTDATRRSRCSALTQWEAVQAVTFTHLAEPTKRVRRRGGATFEQALGGVSSSLHGARLLPRVHRPPEESEENAIRELTKDEQDAWLRSMLVDLGLTFAMRLADHMQAEHGIANAPVVLMTKWNATYSRFWSDGEVDMPGRWTATATRDPLAPWSLSFVESERTASLADIVSDVDKERHAIAGEASAGERGVK